MNGVFVMLQGRVINDSRYNKYVSLLGIFVLAMALLSACASVPGAERVAAEQAAKQMEEQWGVKILALRPTANGYMLDFRYRVTNAAKATPIMDRNIKPYLVVEKDASKLFVPVTNKLGALRNTSKFVKENRNYFMFFANPGKHVNSGDAVTIVIGDFKAEHVMVN